MGYTKSVTLYPLNAQQEAFIRFIDTPGFDLEKDLDEVIKEMKKIFKDFQEGKERIPVILYFMNPVGRNSTRNEKKQKKMIEILKFMKENNAKVIFVITHISKRGTWQKKNSFIQSLKENKLENLIEKDSSNIIKCELVGENAYGIKEIFKKIYEYINFIEGTDKLYGQSLIEEIKKRKTFDEKLKFIKTKTSLFNEFQTKEDIITYGNKKSNTLIASMSLIAAGAGAIPVPFADASIVMSILASSIIKIGKYFGYVWKKISRDDLISIYKGELYKEKENEKKNENDFGKKEALKVIGEIFGKGIIMAIALNIDDVIKTLWGVGTVIGMAVGAVLDSGIILQYTRYAKKYFESKCKEDDGTLFFCTRCSEYEVIFRKFKNFENYEINYPMQ